MANLYFRSSAIIADVYDQIQDYLTLKYHTYTSPFPHLEVSEETLFENAYYASLTSDSVEEARMHGEVPLGKLIL